MSAPLPRADLLLAGALTVAGQLEAWTLDLEGRSRAVPVIAVLVATVAIAAQRRHPGGVALVVVAALTAKEALHGGGDVVILLLTGVVAIFGLGARSPWPRSAVLLAVVLAITSLAAVAGDDDVPGELLFTWVTVGAPWVAGRLVRDRTERAAMLEELAHRREKEGRDQARLAAAEERARIARELHDMVGHSVSVMVLQAGAAEQVVERRPDAAAASLASIQETGRAALDELRRLLGLLEDDEAVGSLEPAPTLDDLEGLIAQLRSAGLDVQLRVEGPPAELPPALALTAFRILQEALTNVIKHARPARARVTVRYLPRSLALEVSDDGRGAAAANPAGHGLVGMQDRVALYGGRLEAGADPAGGFRVRAELPLGGGVP